MAIEKMAGQQSGGIVVIDGGTVRVVRSAAFEAPKAASYLALVPEELRPEAIEDLLEHGAAAASLAQTSAHIVMLEAKIGELTAQLSLGLAKQLRESGADSSKVLQQMLQEHEKKLMKLLLPLTDEKAKDGLPARMLELLELANRQAMKQLAVMLEEGDQGALAKVVKEITTQIKATGVEVMRTVAADQALRHGSVRRGGIFEEVLGVRLASLVRPIGRLEPCSRSAGDKAANVGDYLVALDGYEPELRIVVEAKSQKAPWSTERIRRELKAARANRAAAVAILVADGHQMLPGKVGFGQVGAFEFFVAFDPETGDDTALACAIYLAKAAAISTIAVEAADQVDVGAIHREVSVMRGLLEAFGKIDASGSKINREVDSIRRVGDDLKSELLASLRRLDALVH